MRPEDALVLAAVFLSLERRAQGFKELRRQFLEQRRFRTLGRADADVYHGGEVRRLRAAPGDLDEQTRLTLTEALPETNRPGDVKDRPSFLGAQDLGVPLLAEALEQLRRPLTGRQIGHEAAAIDFPVSRQ